MYDAVAYLLLLNGVSYDTYGNEVITYTKRQVYVSPRGVYQAEFYNAAQAGLHPSITFMLTNRADYQGEKLIEFEGEVYDIIRDDWNAQKDKIYLVCEKRVVNG